MHYKSNIFSHDWCSFSLSLLLVMNFSLGSDARFCHR